MICYRDTQAFFKIKVCEILRMKFLYEGKNVMSRPKKKKGVKVKFLVSLVPSPT